MSSLLELDRPRARQGAPLLRAFNTSSAAVALTAAISLATPAAAQTPPARPDGAVAVAEPAPRRGAESDAASGSGQPASGTAAQPNDDRYRDGIVIWETPADARVPFLLKFNINTQLRYLNTQDSDETFTDHLGVVRDVHTRNDITVNRAMFILGGYIFDPRLRYSFTVWTSAGAASIIVASNIG
jgi:hypothetical protein